MEQAFKEAEKFDEEPYGQGDEGNGQKGRDHRMLDNKIKDAEDRGVFGHAGRGIGNSGGHGIDGRARGGLGQVRT